MKEFMNEKLIPKIMAFVNTKAIQALKDGLLYAMPMMIVGSIFLLIANFPIESFTNWLANAGIKDILDQIYGCTFNVMAMIGSVGIAYTYVKNEGYQGLPAGVISLCSYLIIQPSKAILENGETVDVIFKTWTAGQGMIAAIIMGLLVGWIYSIFMKKDITIKMPPGVPDGVATSFTALIPAAVIIIGVAIIYSIFSIGLNMTPIEWIYSAIQTPLQGVTDSFGGVLFMAFLIPFLWFFGIHGSTIVSGIMQSLLLANSAENQAIIDAGLELTRQNGGHIVTMQFLDQFITFTGSGITIGLVIFMAFFAKSSQCKQLGKLGLGPSVFNINEPILFGTPIVLNPLMAVPFMLMPILSGTIQYFAIYIGLCPMYSGVVVPWTTPPIISGFLIGGWRTALLQIFVLVLSFFVYFPFIKFVDKNYYNTEMEAKGEQ